MKYRKLRIAWSVFCGIACVLLIALWVRSYWRTEFVERMVSVNPLYASGVHEQIVNCPGKVAFFRESVVNNSQVNYTPRGWTYRAYVGVAKDYKSLAWMTRTRVTPQSVFSFPHYFTVLLVGGVGVG